MFGQKMPRPFTDDDAAWLRSHCSQIEREFSPFFEDHIAVFPEWPRLIDRLGQARDAVLARGWERRQQIEEAHNEICVAVAILDNPNSLVRRLEYEPPLQGTLKTIDFVAVMDGRPRCFVDVKTIAPRSIDRWEQYERAREGPLLGDPPMLGLHREWLGGEIWHAWFTARGRMLEYTLELEDKISVAGLVEQNAAALLVLCSNGFDWHEDALEDFVAFYADGRHRFDDPFAAMERHDIEARRLELPRRLRTFSYLERGSGALCPAKIVWHVTPPRVDGLPC